jgi:hypothetical protein
MLKIKMKFYETLSSFGLFIMERVSYKAGLELSGWAALKQGQALSSAIAKKRRKS